MKKLIAMLVALAMILVMAPAVFAAETALADSIPVKSGTEALTDIGFIEFYYTPDADGILTLTLSADTGYKFWVYDATDASLGLPKDGASGTYEYELQSGMEYRIYIIGYYNWGEAAATITYDASFTPAELEVDMVDKDMSDVVLELGANSVDLLENTIVSLYQFVPSEPGIYTITAENATVATYSIAWTVIAEGENGVLVHTATAAEQTVIIGLTAESASVNVQIEKTGDYVPPVQIVYEDYATTCPLVTNFTDPADLVNVDINKAQAVVLGSDGYYHLGSANGPLVYVNLNNDQLTLAMLYAAGAPIHMRGTYVDENGQDHYYNFMNMIGGVYYDYSLENDYHPLNKDLMIFLKAYGKGQGWYNPSMSSFATIQSGEFVEESAWLASCYSTVSYVEPAPGGNEGGNEGGGSSVSPETGDFGVMGAMIAMTVSAIGGIAVLKKKEN